MFAGLERGKAAARQCLICHGQDGKGDTAKGIPDLTGQPPGYLQNQILLFKADRRSPGDDVVKAAKAIMKTIPDAMLGDLAAYYSSLSYRGCALPEDLAHNVERDVWARFEGDGCAE